MEAAPKPAPAPAATPDAEDEQVDPEVPYALMGMVAAQLSDEDSPSDVEADLEHPVIAMGFEDNSFSSLPAQAFGASSSALPSSSGASDFGDFQAGDSGWVAEFEEEAPRMPPLEEEEVTLIKNTMAELNIKPPAWVQKMQQVQRIQAALGQGTNEDALNEQWRLEVQRTAGPSILSDTTVLQASPLLAMPAAAGGISGISGPKRVTAKQLAAERRALRAKAKADRERQRGEAATVE